ncbi:MAG TPA: FAD:protein FMN transferase [Candidatus Limnocylindrales bacterium]|nr:FAD:protein FMN transferase [Candidatus Limnocylindrales bacterium]
MKLAAALAFTILLVCASASHAAVARDGQPVMGTVLTVTVVAGDRATAERLVNEAIDEARRWDDALTIWRDDGELARFNRRAGKGASPVSARLEHGLLAMLELSKQSGGAFEPAVAMLPERGDAHALLRRVGDCLAVTPAHDGAGVRSASRRATTAAPEHATAKLDAGCALDPGGIGKGLALDAIVALLSGRGATAVFLDFGGSSQTAIGAPPGNSRGWPVLISGLADGKTHGTVLLNDSSLSTSRSGATDTRPILDPRTKLPVPGPRLATVLARSATAADAWSTALVVLGEDGIEKARAANLQVFLESARGASATPGFPFDHSSAPGRE